MHPHAHFPDLPVEGKPDAPVRIIAFEDLQCPDTAVWRRMLDDTLLPRFGGRVAFVARDFPLDHHNWAELAAIASRRFASHDNSAAIEFRRYCLSHIQDINPENLPDRIAEFAEAHGLDPEESILALESDDLRNAVRNDLQEGRRLGVRKTPTVIAGPITLLENFTVHEAILAVEGLIHAQQL